MDINIYYACYCISMSKVDFTFIIPLKGPSSPAIFPTWKETLEDELLPKETKTSHFETSDQKTCFNILFFSFKSSQEVYKVKKYPTPFLLPTNGSWQFGTPSSISFSM